MKQCRDCGELKELSEFYTQRKKKADGTEYVYYNPECKECTKKRSRKWQSDNHERYLEICRKDNKSKDRKLQFKKNQERLREEGYHKDYYENNKKQFNEYGRFRRMHKTHEITDEEWEDCKNYFNYRCAYCELPIERHEKRYAGEFKWTDFHQEHVDDEGSNDLSNCIPSCHSCNSSKHTNSLEEWYNEDNPIYMEYRLNKIYIWLYNDYQNYIKKGG